MDRTHARTRNAAAATCAVLALCLVAPAAARAKARDASAMRGRDAGARETLDWSWRLAPGKTVEIKDVNGDIHATIATGESAGVHATKSARKSDPASVRVEAVEHEGGVTVCVLYPGRDGRPGECEPGEGGSTNVRDNDVRVDFEVRVPAGVRLVARTVNGSVEAADLGGPVEARTVNGSVDVSTTDVAEAASVNGSIHAHMGRASFEDRLEFSTVNGRIALEVPPGLSARLEASTVNGDIESDFPVTVSGRFGPRKMSGTIGKGGPGSLKLSTVNGDIRFETAH